MELKENYCSLDYLVLTTEKTKSHIWGIIRLLKSMGFILETTDDENKKKSLYRLNEKLSKKSFSQFLDCYMGRLE